MAFSIYLAYCIAPRHEYETSKSCIIQPFARWRMARYPNPSRGSEPFPGFQIVSTALARVVVCVFLYLPLINLLNMEKERPNLNTVHSSAVIRKGKHKVSFYFLARKRKMHCRAWARFSRLFVLYLFTTTRRRHLHTRSSIFLNDCVKWS